MCAPKPRYTYIHIHWLSLKRCACFAHIKILLGCASIKYEKPSTAERRDSWAEKLNSGRWPRAPRIFDIYLYVVLTNISVCKYTRVCRDDILRENCSGLFLLYGDEIDAVGARPTHFLRLNQCRGDKHSNGVKRNCLRDLKIFGKSRWIWFSMVRINWITLKS